MSKSKLRARYRRIVFFFARVILGLLGWEWLLPRLGLRRLAQDTRPRRLHQIAVAYRELAIEMGGVLIKVGQFLSARLDVLPIEITSELATLQDAVPQEKWADILRVLEEELGAGVQDKFVELDQVPMAAASLGQVHRARIVPTEPSGGGEPITRVVVKVQRPEIEELINVDLSALRVVGRWVNRYRPVRKRANVPALLDEFSRSLYEEVDYLAEGRNAETFAINFQDRPGVCIPRVIWPLTTRRVLTLQDVAAIKITDYDAIAAAGIDRADVAKRLLDTYLIQIFEDGFFHADPHPGNLFVDPQGAGAGWCLTFVDFGMVGHVPPNTDEGLREGLIGLATRDAGRVVHAFQILGMLLPGADIPLLERAITRVFGQTWGKNVTEVQQMSMEEMREFAAEFRDLLYDMPFQIPENLILFGRTIPILSGMCTGLDPNFNLWNRIVPYARKLLTKESGGQVSLILNELRQMVGDLAALPGKAVSVLSKLEQGEMTVRIPQITDHLFRIERIGRRLAGALVLVALAMTGTQLYLAGLGTAAVVLWAGAGVALLWTVLVR